MTNITVRVEHIEERHLASYVELSRAEYGESAISNIAHLRWKFLDNPQGPSTGVHVFAGDHLIARLVAQPRAFRAPGVQVRGAYIVDLVVHPDHRGMPVLLALFNGYKQLRDRYAFVLVTPNDAGGVVWRNFARLPECFALNICALPLQPAHLARRYLLRGSAGAAAVIDGGLRKLAARVAGPLGRSSRLRLERTWPNTGDLDRLFAASPRTNGGVRDSTFINWRFKRSPVFTYDVAFIYKDEALSGYIATRRTVFMGYNTRFLIDVYGTDRLIPGDWSSLTWRMLADELTPGGAELFLILGNTAAGPLADLARFPLLDVPKRFIPQQTAVFAQWWSPPAFEFTQATFALTLADCDML